MAAQVARRWRGDDGHVGQHPSNWHRHCSSRSTTTYDMEVSVLLTLPTTSSGLEFLKSSPATQEWATDGSASSPRRKIARLDTDSDIASSSSRSRSKTLKGPITIRVIPDESGASPASPLVEDVAQGRVYTSPKGLTGESGAGQDEAIQRRTKVHSDLAHPIEGPSHPHLVHVRVDLLCMPVCRYRSRRRTEIAQHSAPVP